MRITLFNLLFLLFIVSCSKSTDSTSNNGTSTSNTSTTGATLCTQPIPKSKLLSVTVFPANHPLNADVSAYPIDINSSNIISTIGAIGLHPDFGSGLYNGAPIGIPFSLVCGNQTKVSITYRANSYDGNNGSESDAGPMPIPLDAAIEGNGNGDSHVLTADVENGKLYELYNASKTATGWEASCGCIFDLNSVSYRTEGWTSADAAGLPILPCLTKYDEVSSGNIHHAVRFTLSKSKVYKGYVSPANHKVNGTGTLNSSLPMGARLRLKSSVDISTYSANNQVILKAMKKYGIILADIGSDMFISGAPDSRWDNNDLNQLKKIKSTDFEVLQIGSIK